MEDFGSDHQIEQKGTGGVSKRLSTEKRAETRVRREVS